jgi:HK97 family phage portal protein
MQKQTLLQNFKYKAISALVRFIGGNDLTNYRIGGQLAKLVASSNVGDLEAFRGVNVPELDDQYIQIGYIRRAVNARAEAITSIPLQLFDKKGKEVTNNSEYEILYRPNFKDTFNQFWKITSINLDIQGWVIWQLVRNNSGKIVEIFNLHPENTEIITDPINYISGYKYTVNGHIKEFSTEDILCFGNYNPKSDYPGLSRLAAVAKEVELGMNEVEYRRYFFKNGAVLSLIVKLSPEMSLDENSRKKFEGELINKFTGTKNMHRIMVLGAGMDAQNITIPPKDLEFAESRRLNKNEIGGIFGVPPILMNDFSDSSRLANADTEERLFWQNTILSQLREFECILNYKLFPKIFPNDNNGIYCKYDISQIYALRHVMNDKIDKLNKIFALGAITPDEIRQQITGLPAVGLPETQSVYLPISMIAIGQIKPPAEYQRQNIEYNFPKYSENQLRAFSYIWKIFRARYERQFKKSMVAHFLDQKERVLKNFDAIIKEKTQTRDVVADVILGIKVEQLFDMITEGKNVEDSQKALIFQIVKDAYKMTIDGYKLKGDYKRVEPAIINLISNRLKTLTNIEETTRGEIVKVLEKGLSESWSIAQYREGISSVFEEASSVRANMIAVTETTYAQNTGIQEAFLSADVRAKTWLSMRDDEVRETHREENIATLTVSIIENFYVGGEYLPYPGAGSDPGNNINCRCTIIPNSLGK